jgi:hypothetical protein
MFSNMAGTLHLVGITGIFLALMCSGQVQAQACVVHSQGDHIDVKVCQENRTIPAQLFSTGFCQPALKGQTVDVTYADHCPLGAFGVCSDAHVEGMPYRQDIHYYSVASDTRYLQPFCEAHSQGKWLAP